MSAEDEPDTGTDPAPDVEVQTEQPEQPDQTDQTDQTEQPEQPEQQAGPRYGRRRRAPRYGSFVVTGAAIGVVLAVAVSFGRPATGQFSQNSVIGYVAAIFGLLGALAGAAVAVLLDRRPR